MAKRKPYSSGVGISADWGGGLSSIPRAKTSKYKGYEWKWEDHLTISSRSPKTTKSPKVKASVESI